MKGLPVSLRTNRNAPPAWQVTLTDNRGPRTRLTGNVQLCGQRCWITPTPRLAAPLRGIRIGVKGASKARQLLKPSTPANILRSGLQDPP